MECIYNGLLSHKKNEIMSFAVTWVDLEIIILSEISQKEKDREKNQCHITSQIPYNVTYMWKLNTTQKKQKQIHTYKE